VRAWHIVIPALVGGLSIPAALYMKSPEATIIVITFAACAIFSALPCFWSIPARFLSGAAAAAGIALINTTGNLAGFVAPYITGALKDVTGSYQVPMIVAGSMMLLSAVLATTLGKGLGAQASAAIPAAAT
jgi:nitrate/nitrite transporter NarK